MRQLRSGDDIVEGGEEGATGRRAKASGESEKESREEEGEAAHGARLRKRGERRSEPDAETRGEETHPAVQTERTRQQRTTEGTQGRENPTRADRTLSRRRCTIGRRRNRCEMTKREQQRTIKRCSTTDEDIERTKKNPLCQLSSNRDGLKA